MTCFCAPPEKEERTINALAVLLAVVLVVPTAYLVLVSAYLFVLAVAAYFFRKQTDPGASPLRFALVFPAHNEEGQIEVILADARNLDYPRDRFDVFVIADNCTDRTAELVRASGATAVERNDPDLRGKGPAIDWFLRTQRATLEGYDAIALVDADMQIDARFLAELNAALGCPGHDVVQASNAVARPEANWRTALGYLGFSVINHVRPAGRETLGGTADLKGSGMAFRAPLLLRYGWPAHSLAEDAEFAKQLLLDGVPVYYNPDARVTSELAVSRAQARVQQARWEGGRLDILRRYLPVLARRAWATRRWIYVDALLDVLVPPLSVLVMLLVAVGTLSWLVHPAWSALVGACTAAVAFCVLSGPLLCRAPARVWVYLAVAPFFVAWKVVLYATLLLRRAPVSWQRTPRDGETKS